MGARTYLSAGSLLNRTGATADYQQIGGGRIYLKDQLLIILDQ